MIWYISNMTINVNNVKNRQNNVKHRQAHLPKKVETEGYVYSM